MNILVLNGSPKGEYSITLQTVHYLEQRFPAHRFHIIHAGQRIRALERDLSPVLEGLAQADLVLFSYPVYTFLAPSQLHRLFELIKASGADLSGKYAAQLSTSKHFYDVTAHRYVQENCQDLGMKYLHGLSADMDDLLKEAGRTQAEEFFRFLCRCVELDSFEPLPPPPPPAAHCPVSIPAPAEKTLRRDVVILTDRTPEDTQLSAMIARFQAVLPCPSRVINLREFPFQGGCLGCFRCAVSGRCVYTDRFDDFLRGTVQSADAIVYAFTIRDHSMGALFKQYDDRQFCNGHRTVTMGAPVGYLISGSYRAEANLQLVLNGRAQVGGNFLAGAATDEQAPDHAIDRMAAALAYALERHYAPPANFLGVGGMKIFRDLIYLMRGMMRADHKFYKAHGQYDFPQKHRETILKMYLVGALLSSPRVLAKMGNKMNEGMIAPYRKVLEQSKPQ